MTLSLSVIFIAVSVLVSVSFWIGCEYGRNIQRNLEKGKITFNR